MQAVLTIAQLAEHMAGEGGSLQQNKFQNSLLNAARTGDLALQRPEHAPEGSTQSDWLQWRYLPGGGRVERDRAEALNVARDQVSGYLNPAPQRTGSGWRSRGAAQRTEADPVPLPAADWELWAHMPKATVREAVALSLGIEPRPPALVQEHDAPQRQYEPHPEVFARRLALAAAHVDAAGPLRPLGYMPMLNGAEGATVALAEFRAWAEGLGWELPARFPRAAVAHVPAAELAPDKATEVPEADRGECVKRAALIERNRRRWPSIERDLQDASSNGLSAAARATRYGFWWEGDALRWAEVRNKRPASAASASLTSVVHRMAG